MSIRSRFSTLAGPFVAGAVALCLPLVALAAESSPASTTTPDRHLPSLKRLDLAPACFVENRGQWDEAVRYGFDGKRMTVAFTDSGPVFRGRANDAGIPAAFAAAVAAGFAIGLVNGIGISYVGIPPLIMTLAMANVVEGLSLLYTHGYPTGTASPALEALGGGRIIGIPNVLLLWIGLIVAATLLLFRKRWGAVLFGVGANSVTAELSGINVKRFRMFVYAISGAIAGLAGFFVLGYTGTPYLNLGAPYLMTSIAAVAIGGISLAGGAGSYIGAAIGCILLTTLSSILVALKTTEAVRQIVYGSLVFIIVVAYTRRRKE
jgi:ribose transport system permease protein